MSCYSGEGTSTVARHLAATAAATSNRSVLLVDGNRSRASVHRAFGVDLEPGLGDVLVGRSSISEVVHATPLVNFDVLTIGDDRRAGGASESTDLTNFVRELREEYDLVVVDLPPVLESGSAQAAAALDGVLLVIESERVRWEVGQRAAALLARSGVRLLGAVLNKRREHIPGWLYRRL
jgi:Mrp family chromosome partitioning ATPase